MAKKDEITKIYVELKSQEVIVVENTNTIKANKYDKLCYEINKDLIDNFLNIMKLKKEKEFSSSVITKYLKLRLSKTLLKENQTLAEHTFMNTVRDKIKQYNEDLHVTLDHIIKDVNQHCVTINKRATPSKKKPIIERELKIRSTNHSPKKKFPRTKVDNLITTDDKPNYKETFAKDGQHYEYSPEDYEKFVAIYDEIDKNFLQLQQEGLLSVYHIYKLRKKITQNIRNISYYNEVGNLENIEFIREDMKGYLVEKKEDPTPTYEYSEDEIFQIFAYISSNKKLITQQVIVNRSDQIKVGKLQTKMNSIIKDLGFVRFQENMELLHNLEEEILLSSEIEQEFLNQKIDDESSTL